MSATQLTPMADHDSNSGVQHELRRGSLDSGSFKNLTSSTKEVSRPLSKLDVLEVEIRQVEREQENVQQAMEKRIPYHGINDPQMLEDNLRRLWRKEEQLRTKEEQLRKKELFLLSSTDRTNRRSGESLHIAETEGGQLIQAESTTMTCKFRSVAGKVFEVHGLLPGMTVQELKAIIAEEKGLPEEDQAFLFAGRQLHDANTLAYYNVTHHSMIHMVLRIAGSSPAGSRRSAAY